MKCGLFLLIYFSFFVVQAQHSLPDTIPAIFDNAAIRFDGVLNDSVWMRTPKISKFTQRDLHFGEPITEKTEVAISYDKFAIYIGVWCYQKDAGKIVSKFLQRDFDFFSDDNFQVILSPFNDKRNGYLFVINPQGARADLLVSGGEEGNVDWNGVWDAKTTVNDQGWFAEIKIPFNTLQFKNQTEHIWGINFERDIRSKNEAALWQGWSRDFSIFGLVNAGTLTGLKNIEYPKHFEFKPYALGGIEQTQITTNELTGKLGGDMNINLTPTLKLNLTSNTDFAQVEADRIAVNLSRFNLYYPEKREFFLEGFDHFQFYLGNSNEVFYTRKIGVENFTHVPILAGARLFGKVGRNNIGLLNIETGQLGSIPRTNNTVVRYKRDLGKQSYIGGIFTNKLNNITSNQVAGIDGSFTTSKFLKNKNLVISMNLAQSMTDFKSTRDALAYRFFIDYPNDIVDQFFSVSSIQNNFNPGMGFLRRKNYEVVNWNVRYTPRVFEKYGVRKMLFKPWEAALYRTQTTGEIESFYNETRPFGFDLKSGETFEFNLQQSYDRLDNSFNVTDSAIIPTGKYWMYKYEFQFSTFQARRLWVSALYNWGGFYTGKIETFEFSTGINISKHFNIRNDYTYNLVKLPGATVTTNELADYLNYAFTTKLGLSIFTQLNSLDDILRFNFRLHWIPKVGSDLYIVYTQGHERLKQIEILKPQSTVAVAKLVYRIIF